MASPIGRRAPKVADVAGGEQGRPGGRIGRHRAAAWVAAALALGALTGFCASERPGERKPAPRPARAALSAAQRGGLSLQAKGHFESCRYDRAISPLKRLVDAGAATRHEKRMLAEAYVRTKQPSLALPLYEELIRTAPRRVRDNVAGEWDGLVRAAASAAMSAGRYRQAVYPLEQALAVHPWDLDLRDALYRAYQRSGQQAKADRLLWEARSYYKAQDRRPPGPLRRPPGAASRGQASGS